MAILVGGGILGYCYWMVKEETEISEIKAPEEKKSKEEKERIPIFPCIGLEIEPNTCTTEINADTEKIMEDYLSNYVHADLSNAEINYCLLEEDKVYMHYWRFKAFYLGHWIGIATRCFTELTETLPIGTPKFEKEFYTISIFIYAGKEYPIDLMMVRGLEPGVAFVDINRRKTELASAREAQAELSRYWKLDISSYNLKLEQTTDWTWAYIFVNLESRPQILVRIEKDFDAIFIRYGRWEG